ncbi:MAG: hypothetical protein ACP5D7_06060 [Limnospira sp.]
MSNSTILETDVVVIGSGIGGLSCVALLAWYGFDIAVNPTTRGRDLIAIPPPIGNKKKNAPPRCGRRWNGSSRISAMALRAIAANTLAPVEKHLELLGAIADSESN